VAYFSTTLRLFEPQEYPTKRARVRGSIGKISIENKGMERLIKRSTETTLTSCVVNGGGSHERLKILKKNNRSKQLGATSVTQLPAGTTRDRTTR
jgi:hypothetical protein